MAPNWQLIARCEQFARRVGLMGLSISRICEEFGIPRGSFYYRFRCQYHRLISILRKRGVPLQLEPESAARVIGDLRRDHILECAVLAASAYGLYNMTRGRVAQVAEVSPTLIGHYYRSMAALREAVLRAAIKDRHTSIVADALVKKDKIAQSAPRSLRAAAARSIV